MMSWNRALWAGGVALVLVAGVATDALAHKGKLPTDARTLVQQASALLAQNPGMTVEVKERLQAAVQSKKPEGVDLRAVSAALQALEEKDISGARRLLATALMPAGMPMPPQGVKRPGPTPTGPSPAPAAPPPAAQPAPLPVETAMEMAEPLRAGFSGTPAEYSLLAAAMVLAVFGLRSLRGKAEVAHP